MPHKPRSKFADNATSAPAFKLCDATQHLLTTMNQDHRAASTFTIDEYSTLVPVTWRSQVMDDLLHMHFKLITPLTTSTADTPIKVDNNNKDDSEDNELSPAEELTNAIAAFRQWFESNNIADNVHPGLVENIRCIAMMFSLIPVPHCCPTPPPCICPHQADAPLCNHLHADDISTPPPCAQPHCGNEDIPMEPPAPTHAYSEAALQTPAPSHEASMPPPPPAAVASSPPAGPRG
ncbi:hypothetical protein P691DRAFT_769273 [Macrolepiota fuliginosa MF-IS2]|uniref:Uncharacterized protein n=1 Tax=Macrolepiota fuliginosa MF-IS2 TaxID=1400762 RepID=A0A9P5WVU7_9AGAR|nr:hypothetical protein P691DRAFT_769273 [Macrolepiota fuliginosa MF-IS2]